MNADGTGETRLSSSGSTPAWSPDGAQIAFADNGIWVMNPDPANLQLRRLTTQGFYPSWSPDGTQIAFGAPDPSGKGADLWIVNAFGNPIAQWVLAFPGTEIDFSWAPSSKIAFAHSAGRNSPYTIYHYDPVSLVLTQVTDGSIEAFWPAWSSDGTLIAFSNGNGIWVIDANGATQALYIGPGAQPSWAP